MNWTLKPSPKQQQICEFLTQNRFATLQHFLNVSLVHECYLFLELLVAINKLKSAQFEDIAQIK